MSGINGMINNNPQGLPPGSYDGQPTLVATSALRAKKGIRATSNSFIPANLNTVAQAFVSPGMWQDSVAAVYADTRKTFHFGAGGDGTVWASAAPEHITTPAMMNPITMRADGRSH